MDDETIPVQNKGSKRKVDFKLTKAPNKDRRASIAITNLVNSRRNSKVINPYDSLLLPADGVIRENCQKARQDSKGTKVSGEHNNKQKHINPKEGETILNGIMLSNYPVPNAQHSEKGQKSLMQTISTGVEDNYISKKEDTANSKSKAVSKIEGKLPFMLKEKSKFKNNLFLHLKENSANLKLNLKSSQPIQEEPAKLDSKVFGDAVIFNRIDILPSALKKSSSYGNTVSKQNSENPKKKFRFLCCF